ERNGRRLIAVVLDEPSNRAMYEDTVALFDYGFSAFTPMTVTAQDLAAKEDGMLLANFDPLTVYVTKTLAVQDLKKNYTVVENTPAAVTVSVSLSLPMPTDLQYEQLGSMMLHFEAQTANAGVQPEVPVPQAPETARSRIIPLLLTLVRVGMVGVCFAVFGIVLLMFYIRVSYDLRCRRSKKRRKKQ
ncbi:MAG: hypothetical protein RR075_07280, partial [Pygmaiobacter sp.]